MFVHILFLLFCIGYTKCSGTEIVRLSRNIWYVNKLCTLTKNNLNGIIYSMHLRIGLHMVHKNATIGWLVTALIHPIMFH